MNFKNYQFESTNSNDKSFNRKRRMLNDIISRSFMKYPNQNISLKEIEKDSTVYEVPLKKQKKLPQTIMVKTINTAKYRKLSNMSFIYWLGKYKKLFNKVNCNNNSKPMNFIFSNASNTLEANCNINNDNDVDEDDNDNVDKDDDLSSCSKPLKSILKKPRIFPVEYNQQKRIESKSRFSRLTGLDGTTYCESLIIAFNSFNRFMHKLHTFQIGDYDKYVSLIARINTLLLIFGKENDLIAESVQTSKNSAEYKRLMKAMLKIYQKSMDQVQMTVLNKPIKVFTGDVGQKRYTNVTDLEFSDTVKFANFILLSINSCILSYFSGLINLEILREFLKDCLNIMTKLESDRFDTFNDEFEESIY